MRTNFKFLLLAILIVSGISKIWAYGEDLESAGWTEVTTLPTSNEELSKYYYVFYATEANLMLAEENGENKQGSDQGKQLTMVYRTPADPATDKTKVWTIEYSNSWNYGFRSLAYPTHFIQTRENATWNVQAAWETIQSMWTRWDFVYANGSWTIENKLQDDKRDNGAKNKKIYIGPWNDRAFADNNVVAGNKQGDNVGKFKIYSIPRSSLGYIDDFNAVKAKLSVLKDQTGAYTDNNGAVQAFENAISAAESKAKDGSPKDIADAIEAVKKAAVTFLQSVTVNSGKSFDVTAFITNPDFADNNTNGWDKTVAGTTRAHCHEYWNTTFDISQTLTGLPVGSYSLSVQAFTRPGGNAEAYRDYKNGINNVHAELYVNSNASKVGNIYDYKGNTTGAKVKDDDYPCDGYWVPNGMEGADLYFQDPEVYKTTVAALVEDGNLKIGFRDNELTPNQWTIFSHFHLYYYGESKIIYYQQYLPQLKEEVSADLDNGAYNNIQGKERYDLIEKLEEKPSEETDEAYEAVINAILEAQTTFRASVDAYNTLATQKAFQKIEVNVGNDAFQVKAENNDKSFADYQAEVAKCVVDPSTTKKDVEAYIEKLNEAIEVYKNRPVNAPDATTPYTLTLTDAGFSNKGNALEFVEGGTTADQNSYGLKYTRKYNPNTTLQRFFFEVAEGVNIYNIWFTDNDGVKRYICDGTVTNAGTGAFGIRTTPNANEALAIKVLAGNDEGITYLWNTKAEQYIGSNGGDMYTDPKFHNYSIAEAEKATVDGNLDAGKFATRIYPFAPEAIDGVTFYSCASVEGEKLTLEKVTEPEANTPYILYNTTDKSIDITASGYGTLTDATTPAVSVGLLTGVYTEEETVPVGSYVLQTQEGVQAFYKVAEEEAEEGTEEEPADFKATPYRAYLTIKDSGNTNGLIKAYYFSFGDDDATAIKTVTDVTEGAENAVIYNLAGQRVATPVKGGIYIVNGQKVLVK